MSMMQDDVDHELNSLFETADAELETDSEQFVGEVMARVHQRVWLRKGLLSGAAAIGGVIAAFQTPDMLMMLNGFVGLPDDLLSASIILPEGFWGSHVQWIGAALLGAGAMIATLTTQSA